MDEDKQQNMLRTAASRSLHDYEKESRRYRIATTLIGLGLKEGTVTGWFDESEHDGKRYATRIKRLPPNKDALTFVVQIGLAITDEAVGSSESGTFVFSFGDVRFGESEADRKVAELHKLNHVNQQVNPGGPLATEHDDFAEIEFTILRAGALHAAGELSPQVDTSTAQE